MPTGNNGNKCPLDTKKASSSQPVNIIDLLSEPAIITVIFTFILSDIWKEFRSYNNFNIYSVNCKLLQTPLVIEILPDQE